MNKEQFRQQGIEIRKDFPLFNSADVVEVLEEDSVNISSAFTISSSFVKTPFFKLTTPLTTITTIANTQTIT